MKSFLILASILVLSGSSQAQTTALETPGVALVMGRSAYPGLEDLRYAAGDAKAVGTELRRLGFEVATICESEVTRKHVLNELDRLLARARPGAPVVVYWSGHTGMFEKASSLVFSREDVLPLAEVAKHLARKPGHPSVMIVDGSRYPLGKQRPHALCQWTDVKLLAGQYLFCSAQPGAGIYAREVEWGHQGCSVAHSVFTYHLLHALRSGDADGLYDQVMHADEIAAWMKKPLQSFGNHSGFEQAAYFVGSAEVEVGNSVALARVEESKLNAKAQLDSDLVGVPVRAGMVSLRGTVTDHFGVGSVMVSVNGGEPVPATFSGNRWSVALRLGSGRCKIKMLPLGRWGDPCTESVAWLEVSDLPKTAPSGLSFREVNAQGFEEYSLDKDPSVILIRVPGGTFTMGAVGGAPNSQTNEQAAVRITLGAYFIGKYEISQQQFARFSAATKRPLPPAPKFGRVPSHPEIRICYADVSDYCTWAGLRVPTEAEWEFAARGPQSLSWPFGHKPPKPSEGMANFGKDANSYDSKPDDFCDQKDGHLYLAPITAYPKGVGPFGTFNQSGNADEWCSDWEGPLPSEAGFAGFGTGTTAQRIVKGGGYRSRIIDSAPWRRRGLGVQGHLTSTGFRVAR